jgi:hypothetical protein
MPTLRTSNALPFGKQRLRNSAGIIRDAAFILGRTVFAHFDEKVSSHTPVNCLVAWKDTQLCL